MVRKILTASVGLLLCGCPIPSTLGLPCEVHEHCDPGQHCMEGVCEQGPPGETMMPPPTMTGPTTADPTGETGTSSTDPSTSSTTEPETTSSTTAGESSSSTTGPTCGVDACTDLDILLIVDNSDSMFQWLLPLSNSLPTLFGLFDDQLENVCSFHIGFANAEQMPQANTAECQFPGALIQRMESCDGDPTAPPYFTNDEFTAAEAFDELQCMFITQGFGGDEDERMLEATLGALNPANNVAGACNDGFRRPGANLALLYVSDENDPTPSGEQDTLAELFQRYVDPNLVVFIGVVGDATNTEPSCQWVPDGEEGTGAEVPSALSGFLALSGIPSNQQARVDICQSTAYEFEDAFEVFTSVCGG